MMVLEANIAKTVYSADFGRVEGLVSLLVKIRQGQPPHWIQVRTNQPQNGDTPLEARLIEDATRLARGLGMGGGIGRGKRAA